MPTKNPLDNHNAVILEYTNAELRYKNVINSSQCNLLKITPKQINSVTHFDVLACLADKDFYETRVYSIFCQAIDSFPKNILRRMKNYVYFAKLFKKVLYLPFVFSD